MFERRPASLYNGYQSFLGHAGGGNVTCPSPQLHLPDHRRRRNAPPVPLSEMVMAMQGIVLRRCERWPSSLAAGHPQPGAAGFPASAARRFSPARRDQGASPPGPPAKRKSVREPSVSPLPYPLPDGRPVRPANRPSRNEIQRCCPCPLDRCGHGPRIVRCSTCCPTNPHE